MPKTEIESPEALREHLDRNKTVVDVIFQGVDLIPFEDELLKLSLQGCVFLGCKMTSELAPRVARYGCLLFPVITGYPYNPFRAGLYSPEELFQNFRREEPGSYYSTPDRLTYISYIDPATKKVRPASIDEVLARRLHDSSVADALEEFLLKSSGEGAVAVMGGHDMERTKPVYRQVAELCRDLARAGYLMISGGGPGIMEATNLGAYLAPHDDGAIADAIEIMKGAAKYNDPGWLAKAYEVREKYPLSDKNRDKARSLGVPTWFYGHEPPNAFATHIAKYFENSVREEGLLAIGTHGVIFAEGNGGTVQEIFQDACQNYYKTYERASPMFLFDKAYWNFKWDYDTQKPSDDKKKPAWPLLQQIAHDGKFENRIFLTDSSEEIKTEIVKFTEELKKEKEAQKAKK